MRQITTNIYSFDELPESAKKLALENLHYINVEQDWYSTDYDLFKTLAEAIGIDIDKIFFSGFWSQGDGACFIGTYCHDKNALTNFESYTDIKEITDIANKLHSVHVEGHIKIIQSGRYYHAETMRFEYSEEVNLDNQQIIEQALKAFANFIYKQLESTYDHLTSEEAIIDTITSNNYEFTIDGKIYN